MSRDTTVIAFRQPDIIDDPLTELAREGARRILAQVLIAEADAFVAMWKDEKLPDGRDRIVRHGHGPYRAIQTGVGPVEVRRAKERRITRWEHQHVLEAVQRRLDEHPEKMRQRRETVEHPSGTIKARMGATHFLMKTLPRVAAEMALHVLAYNMTRAMSIMGVRPLLAAIRA